MCHLEVSAGGFQVIISIASDLKGESELINGWIIKIMCKDDKNENVVPSTHAPTKSQ